MTIRTASHDPRNERILADFLADYCNPPKAPTAADMHAKAMSRVMHRAHDLTRATVAKLGGSYRATFAEALRIAHAENAGRVLPLVTDLRNAKASGKRQAMPQRRNGYRGRDWYASAVGG